MLRWKASRERNGILDLKIQRSQQDPMAMTKKYFVHLFILSSKTHENAKDWANLQGARLKAMATYLVRLCARTWEARNLSGNISIKMDAPVWIPKLIITDNGLNKFPWIRIWIQDHPRTFEIAVLKSIYRAKKDGVVEAKPKVQVWGGPYDQQSKKILWPGI